MEKADKMQQPMGYRGRKRESKITATGNARIKTLSRMKKACMRLTGRLNATIGKSAGLAEGDRKLPNDKQQTGELKFIYI